MARGVHMRCMYWNFRNTEGASDIHDECVTFRRRTKGFWNGGEKKKYGSRIFICTGRDAPDVIFASREDGRLEVLGFGLIRISAEDEDIGMMFHAFGDSRHDLERPHGSEENFFFF